MAVLDGYRSASNQSADRIEINALRDLLRRRTVELARVQDNLLMARERVVELERELRLRSQWDSGRIR